MTQQQNMPEHYSTFLADEAATVDFGQQLSGAIAAVGGTVIFLQGNLGMGKTTLTRGILQGLGHTAAVKSPTYTLVEPYELAGMPVYHFDLYRLNDPEELEYMGVRDYFSAEALCLIEWPERGEGLLPAADLDIHLSLRDYGRNITLTAGTETGRQILCRLPEVNAAENT